MDLTTRPNALAHAFALEPRYMFDAAGAVTGADAASEVAAETEAMAQANHDNGDIGQDGAAQDEAFIAALADAGATRPTEIVFIDTGVKGWQTLADGVDPAAETV